jgi:hypothetical protein
MVLLTAEIRTRFQISVEQEELDILPVFFSAK